MKKIINYSGIPGLVLMAALVFLTISCSKEAVKENPEADNSSQLIKISGEDANSGTKTTLGGVVTSWKVGDKVGVFCEEAGVTTASSPNAESFIPQTKNGGVYNLQYTASSALVSSPFTGEMTWGGPGIHHFYAYYPYSAVASGGATLVPITLATGQTQSAGGNSDHIGALDFMVATPVSQAPGSDPISTSVNLRYNHVFTILEFQIKRSSGSGKITKVKLTAPTTNLSLTSGTINITTTSGASSPYAYTISSPVGTNVTILTITEGVTPTADYTTTPKIYMMILPGDFSAESMTIGVEYESSVFFENTTKPGQIFERGHKYVVQMDDTPSTVTDHESNVYNTIRIGSQVWMASNLKTNEYNDGTVIPLVENGTDWVSNTSGKYCWYNNDVTNKATYGALYNWFAVNTGKLCPVGWHVPTDAEWTTLTTYLTSNGYGYDGSGDDIAKSMSATSGWASDGTAGNVGNIQTSNNSSGFTALPGGSRWGYEEEGIFGSDIGNSGYWWCYTENTSTYAYYRRIYFALNNVGRSFQDKYFGKSVRCIKG